MNEIELRKLFNYLTFWEMKNKNKITKPIKYKHFMECLAILLVTFETELSNNKKFSDKVINIKRKGLPERLIKCFGVKETAGVGNE